MLLNDRLGRKLSIMFSALPSVVGYALMAGAQGIGMLLLGRVLTGYAGGVTSASIPVTCPGKEFARDLQGGRRGGSVVEPGASRCFLEAPAELQGWSWLGMGRMHWVNGPGTASPSCPRGAGLSCLQKREDRSSIPALFHPTVISSHVYRMRTARCTQRGRQQLSNPGACLSSNGRLTVPLEHFSHTGVREGSSGACKVVLSSHQDQLTLLDWPGFHPERKFLSSSGFPWLQWMTAR